MIKDFIVQNWTLILVLFAFAISLKMTVFLDKRTIRRMLVMILAVFLLSVAVFAEFRLADSGTHQKVRLVLMAIRYSSTPFILAMVIFTLVKRFRWFIFIPAIAMTAVDIVSIFNGVVFALDASNELVRGPLGYFPYVMAGFYCVFVIYILYARSNKTAAEIVPILFFCFTFLSDLILPFVIGREFSQFFCATISIALFVYYVFSILQLTKKDALTGALNRQAYYADVADEPEEITALVSLDMNGLKVINDTQGHAAGDEALVTLALCFRRALKSRQFGYRIGGRIPRRLRDRLPPRHAPGSFATRRADRTEHRRDQVQLFDRVQLLPRRREVDRHASEGVRQHDVRGKGALPQSKRDRAAEKKVNPTSPDF